MGSGRGESGRVQEWADQSLASQGMRGGEQGVGGVERVVRRREAGVMRAVSERGARTGSGWERTEWDCETARATKAPVPVRLIVREGARGRGREASAPLRYHGPIGEGVQPRALQTLRSRHIEALILKSKACGAL